MKKRSIVLPVRLALFCSLLLFGLLLFLTACAGPYGPGTQPQSTPSHNGYNLISLIDQEYTFLQSLLLTSHP